MFKTAERIGKNIESLMKIVSELKNEDRKNELLVVIHELSKVHQNVLGDLTKEKEPLISDSK